MLSKAVGHSGTVGCHAIHAKLQSLETLAETKSDYVGSTTIATEKAVCA